VVEKDLMKRNLSRHDVGREKFIELVWEWREKYGGLIINQLKKLGSSCDWSGSGLQWMWVFQGRLKRSL
jgi:valyl-tRNA synthetase